MHWDQIIVDNTNRMDGIITGLLKLSKVSSSEFNKTNINMDEMINSIYQEFVSQTDKNRITLTVKQLEEGYGDPVLLRQVWVNLIENAVKFSRKKEKPN